MRKDKDLADMNKMANTQAIRLDVTVQTDIPQRTETHVPTNYVLIDF